jgi:hypothetical protein
MIKEKYTEIKNANEKFNEIIDLPRIEYPSNEKDQDEINKQQENEFIKKEFYLAVSDIMADVDEEYKNPDILIEKYLEYSKEY